jgi:hypothetical protein
MFDIKIEYKEIHFDKYYQNGAIPTQLQLFDGIQDVLKSGSQEFSHSCKCKNELYFAKLPFYQNRGNVRLILSNLHSKMKDMDEYRLTWIQTQTPIVG